jgi:hypothetical protein
LIRNVLVNRDQDFEASRFGCQQQFPVLETSKSGVAGGLALVIGKEKAQPLVNTFVEEQAH